ncbi:MAG: hypothetical protein AB7U85_03170 [Alphaproteobacteria bacterium]
MERNSPIKNAAKALNYNKVSKEERLEKLSFKKKNPRSGGRPQGGGKINFPFKTIHGFELREMNYTVPPSDERKSMRSKFKDVKAHFMKFMAEEHPDQLRELGFSKDEVDYINATPIKDETGRYNSLCPKRYNVHHKLPIHGGGKNEFTNFIIMPIPPHDDLHHSVIDLQIVNIREGETRKVLIPWSDRNAYIPTAKIPGFDKSQDFEATHSGFKKLSRNILPESKKESISMDGGEDKSNTNYGIDKIALSVLKNKTR